MKQPAFQFYPGDWMKDPAVRSLSLEARGLWIDMLCLMHESDRRGYLQHANGKPVSQDQLARMTGCSPDQISRLLQELFDSGVYSCTDHGTIFSRRMVRDEIKRGKCREAGKLGATLKGQRKGDMQGDMKGDGQRKPRPSASASISASISSSGSKGYEPQSRRTPDEIDKMGSLLWGASEGSPVAAGPPDKHLAESVLNAIGDLDTAEKWLAEKMAQGKRPKTSYLYWVTLACAEFVDGRRP